MPNPALQRTSSGQNAGSACRVQRGPEAVAELGFVRRCSRLLTMRAHDSTFSRAIGYDFHPFRA